MSPLKSPALLALAGLIKATAPFSFSFIVCFGEWVPFVHLRHIYQQTTSNHNFCPIPKDRAELFLHLFSFHFCLCSQEPKKKKKVDRNPTERLHSKPLSLATVLINAPLLLEAFPDQACATADSDEQKHTCGFK